MDAYEATKVVFSRIQALDPDNAANIMGMLLIQDHGEKEMIRLAFGPEALLHSVVLKARNDLQGGLAATPRGTATSAPSGFTRHNSAPSTPMLFGSGPPSPATSSTWSPAPVPVFSRTNSGVDGDQMLQSGCGGGGNGCLGYDMAAAGINCCGGSFSDDTFGGADSTTTHEIHDLSSSNPSALSSSSPNGNGVDGAMLFPYGAGTNWPPYRRSCSPMADDMYYLGSEAVWRPCLYYARGYCKNGSSCRFQHAGLQADDYPIDIKSDSTGEELFLRTSSSPNSPRLMSSTQLMASAAPFPYGAGASLLSPTSSAGRSLNFLLQQQQQSENQRAAAAAATLMLGGGDDASKWRSPRLIDRPDYASITNPGSRQIYLTFPADSTFREEDVSNYFSIYGPVQDVRIPYQQKRMFGFVTFVYPETVKIILAKGNPHFVCDARVLVKPYKEKGKIPDKKHPYQQQLDRADFSGCPTPTGLDARDPYDFRPLGPRMLFNASPEVLLRRKLEEQQQAAELQQVIELQSRRFMGLQLIDLKNRSLQQPATGTTVTATQVIGRAASATAAADPEEAPAVPQDKGLCPPVTAGADQLQQVAVDSAACGPVPAAAADKEEAGGADARRSPSKDSDFQESIEHNLPDSPFASAAESHPLSDDTAGFRGAASHLTASSPSFFPHSPSMDMTSRTSPCFLDFPRFSSGHGAVGM